MYNKCEFFKFESVSCYVTAVKFSKEA